MVTVINDLNDLKEFCTETVNNYPSLKDEVMETLSNAICEIEDGESEDNECDIAGEYIDGLIDGLGMPTSIATQCASLFI